MAAIVQEQRFSLHSISLAYQNATGYYYKCHLTEPLNCHAAVYHMSKTDFQPYDTYLGNGNGW